MRLTSFQRDSLILLAVLTFAAWLFIVGILGRPVPTQTIDNRIPCPDHPGYMCPADYIPGDIP